MTCLLLRPARGGRQRRSGAGAMPPCVGCSTQTPQLQLHPQPRLQHRVLQHQLQHQLPPQLPSQLRQLFHVRHARLADPRSSCGRASRLALALLGSTRDAFATASMRYSTRGRRPLRGPRRRASQLLQLQPQLGVPARYWLWNNLQKRFRGTVQKNSTVSHLLVFHASMFMCLYHDGTQRYKVVLVFEYIFEPSAGKSESHTLPFTQSQREKKHDISKQSGPRSHSLNSSPRCRVDCRPLYRLPTLPFAQTMTEQIIQTILCSCVRAHVKTKVLFSPVVVPAPRAPRA